MPILGKRPTPAAFWEWPVENGVDWGVHAMQRSKSPDTARWVAVPRLLNRYLKLRGVGRSVMLLARYHVGLQLVPVRMRDDRVLHLDLREPVCLPYLLTGWNYYERKEPDLLRTLIGRCDTVIDIGANIGWYSTLLSELVGPTGRVFAFEPSDVALRMLKATAKQYQQLTVLADALGAEDCMAELHIPVEIGNASLRPPSEGCLRQMSRVRTLDSFLAEEKLPAVSFVKCDVEGAELDVLRGAKRV